MPGMGTGDEVVSPATGNSPPPPPAGAGGDGPPRHAAPTPVTVLGWIAAAGGRPWFPSQHAAETGTDRDALDEPLAQLRETGLVRIETWVRGAGQGYVLTPEGEQAHATGTRIPGLSSEPLPIKAPPAIPDDPPSRPVFSFALDTRPPLVVPILVIANLLWFFAGLVAVLRDGQPVWDYLSGKNADVLHRLGAVSGIDLLRGEWWRLASSCFVHIGGAHLLLNLFALAMIGPLAELLWGRGRLLIIYALSGLAGSCLAMALHPVGLLAGASGAIWGVLMSLVAWFLLFRPYLPTDVAADWIRRLTLVIVLNAGFSFLPGISWQGHLGGAVAGFVAAGLLNAARFGDRPRRRVALGLLLALPVGCVGGLVWAMNGSGVWATYRQQVNFAEQLRQAAAAGEEFRQAALATESRLRAALAAEQSFNRDVVPLLNQLAPPLVEPVEKTATGLLLRAVGRRDAEAVAEVRAKLTALKKVADTAVGHLAAPPVGVEALDRRLANAKAFAEARSRSFALLLAMLDSPAVPDEAAWTAWGDARRAAAARWQDIAAKR
jgi:rhomboid protease GluP